MEKKTATLRRLLERPGALVLVGAWDCLSARLVESAGFDVVYLGGIQVAHTVLGKTDLGYMTQTELIDTARRVATAISVPLIIDADDGFGNALNVRRTVQLCEQAGIAGIHIEDLKLPKRCAFFGGGGLEPKDAMIRKVKAAADARTDKDFLLIARTDKYEGLDESIARMNAYGEAGADMGMIVGLGTVDEMRKACKEVSIPLWTLQIEGATPALSPAQLEEMGHKMIGYTLPAYFAAYDAARDEILGLKKALADKHRVPPRGRPFSEMKALEELFGLEEDVRVQKEFVFLEG